MYHLKASNLKFCGPDLSEFPKNSYENGKLISTQYWDWLQLRRKNVKPGIVCYRIADECPTYDLFVIVEGTKECSCRDDDNFEGSLKIIFPRIRMIDGKIVLGQDKTKLRMNMLHDTDCPFKNTFQEDYWCNNCDFREKDYSNTFVPQQNNEGDYVIRTFDVKQQFRGWYVGCQSVDNTSINYLDSPIYFSYPLSIT